MLLDILRCHQPITRADVTDLTDLTQQSVHRILEGLIADGLVVIERGKPNGRGKPSPTLHLNQNARYAIGIAIDQDGFQLSMVDFCGALVAEQKVSFAIEREADWISSLIAACHEVLAKHKIDSCNLCGVGLAMDKALRLLSPSSLQSNWPSLVGDALNVPTFKEDAALAAAIGESLTGLGRQFKSFAFISIGHGVSGGMINDGMPFRGHTGNAGDFSYLLDDAVRPHPLSLNSLLTDLQRNGIDVADLFDLQSRFAVNWPGVSDWLNGASAHLAIIVRAVTAIVDPQAIIFGGQMPSALGAILLEELRRLPSAQIAAEVSNTPQLLLSEIAGDAAATGAALLPLKHLYFR